MTRTATFSTFLRHPNDVIENLDDGDVVLTRRDGESIRISKERDAAREDQMMRAFAQMLGAVVLDDDVEGRLVARLRVPFGWLEFLCADEQISFAREFFNTARACAAVGNFERLAVEVENWRETATAYSLGLDDRLEAIEYLEDGVEAEDPRVR